MNHELDEDLDQSMDYNLNQDLISHTHTMFIIQKIIQFKINCSSLVFPLGYLLEIISLKTWIVLMFSGFGVGDMFHTFFSQIVKQQNELDRSGTLPRTPASARKVSSLSGSGSLNRRSIHVTNPDTELFSETTRPQPSPEQQAVMSRLGRGQNAWQQLGIEPGSTQEEVNKAYRKLAVLLHPDKTAVRGADEAFKLLGLARRTILNSLS